MESVGMNMESVSAAEFQRHFGHYQDEALKHPLSITRNGRDRLVVLAVEEYQRLKRRDREVLSIGDFSEADIAAIREAQPSPQAEAFNHEVEF